MEMTVRPTQGSRGNQRENVVFGAFTCRSSRSLDKEEAIVSLWGGGNRERGRNSQLEPQLHEEAPPEQPQSPFILMVGLVGGCGVVVVMLELEVGSCFVRLLVMMMTVMGWDGGNGEEMRILIHTEVDNSVRQTGTSFLAFSTGKRIERLTAGLLRGLCRFLLPSLLRSLCRWRSSPAQPSPTRCKTAPAWEASLANGISSEAHDHPPGSVPSGWRCWTLNDSDGFRRHWWSDPAAGLAGQGGAMRHASPPTRAVCEICA